MWDIIYYILIITTVYLNLCIASYDDMKNIHTSKCQSPVIDEDIILEKTIDNCN